MEQPVICVIVPVYKAEATLPRCIESVLTQQLPGGLRLLLDSRSAKNHGKSAAFPVEATRAERRGYLVGPGAYLRARRRVRRHSAVAVR